jgi:hypothetical protein
MQIHLLPVIVKEDSVSRQSSIDLCGYGLIHLRTAIKEDSVSCQSMIYGWIHLLSAIVKEDSVSRHSSIDLGGYDLIHLRTAIKEDSINLVQIYSDVVRFTYNFISKVYFCSLSKQKPYNVCIASLYSL